MELRLPLFLKAAAAFCPIVGDPLFPVILLPGNLSIGDHWAGFFYLKTSCLVEDHPVVFSISHFQDMALIILDHSQDLACPDHISRHFVWIPQAVLGSRLVNNVPYFQRIIDPIVFLSQINPQMAEDIPHVPPCRMGFLSGPGSHASSFNENTGDPVGVSRIVITASLGHCRADHVGYVHLLSHLPGDFYRLF